MLASHLHSSVLVHGCLEESLAFILANKLSSPTLLPTNLMQLMQQAYQEEPVRRIRVGAKSLGESEYGAESEVSG